MPIAGFELLTTRVLPIGADEAADQVVAWSHQGRGRVVCAANVHMLMEARDDPSFGATLSDADLVVADGRPLVWAAKPLGVPDAQQTRGLDLMTSVCALAERQGLNVGLYGGKPEVLDEVHRRIVDRHPTLDVSYRWSPPFRELTPDEDQAVVEAIAASRTQILFVSLGCPKQERWMAAHRDRLPCVMLGVGAAFDMVAGRTGIAPRWVQHAGLEWLYRLAREPRRLWRRYAGTNPRFVALVARQWLEGEAPRTDRRNAA